MDEEPLCTSILHHIHIHVCVVVCVCVCICVCDSSCGLNWFAMTHTSPICLTRPTLKLTTCRCFWADVTLGAVRYDTCGGEGGGRHVGRGEWR